jgi:hypothetical protein
MARPNVVEGRSAASASSISQYGIKCDTPVENEIVHELYSCSQLDAYDEMI